MGMRDAGKGNNPLAPLAGRGLGRGENPHTIWRTSVSITNHE
jgi:hypothetical protein